MGNYPPRKVTFITFGTCSLPKKLEGWKIHDFIEFLVPTKVDKVPGISF